MEVLHGDIRITLSDQDAIRGLTRTRAEVKRKMKQIERERAVIKIETSIDNLEKNLVKARRELKRFEGLRVEGKLDMSADDVTKKLRKLNNQIIKWEGRKASREIELTGTRGALAKLHATQVEEEKLARIREQSADAEAKYDKAKRDSLQRLGRMQAQAARMDDDRSRRYILNIQKEGQARSRAERTMMSDFAARERRERSLLATQQRAIDLDNRRGLEVAKLRGEYDKANQALQRLQQTGRARRATHPEAQLEFDIKEGKLLEQMAVARAKLKAMNMEPIDVRVDVKQSRAMEKLMGIGDIGMRLGPFTGTLKQFTVAALILGPILTGLLGATTALAGALGAGLVGAVGLAATSLTGFGLILGGVGSLTVTLFKDFKNLNTLQKAYHMQVLKTGANSEKAKTKLAEFNHALGVVTPTTRAAFLSLETLQARWRGLRKEARPDFFNALGESITTVNATFGLFSRETLRAFKVITGGWGDWMKGIRSAEGQNTIFMIMRNTTEAIKSLMPALGNLGAAWGRVTASFSRHFPAIFDGFERWTLGVSNATKNTTNLNRGVDGLMDSFKDTLGVAAAFGRVIIELSRAAMGPGGDMMDDMANGLNEIANTIRSNPTPIRNFFADSIGTVKALYGVLQPVAALFLEFSTILRPATTAVLNILGPITELAAAFLGFGPIRAALQAWATIWLFKRGTAMAIGLITGAVHGLAAALTHLGKTQAAAGLTGMGAWMRGGPRAVPSPVARGGTAPVGGWLGGAPRAAPVAPVAPAAGGALSKGVGAVTRGLGALSVGLLGVSAPVAGVAAAAIGAGIALKKLKDASDAREAQERAAERILKQGAPERPERQTGVTVGRMGAQFNRDPEAGAFNHAEYEARRQAFLAAADAVRDVNNAMYQSGQIQRDLVGIGSQLQNSQLMVEQAEKAYSQAVKTSGRNSLEARMALQQLRDARTQETGALEMWGDASRAAFAWVERGVRRAEAAFQAAKGTEYQDEMAKRLDSARNSAAALEVNLRRAKKGIDIFTGQGAEKIGAMVREFGKIPGVKRVLIQVQDQDVAVKISDIISKLGSLGQRKTVAKILADAENPRAALRQLNAALDRWERRTPEAELRANKQQAQNELNAANQGLTAYGGRKPEALLKARDEAKQKLALLNRQLDHLDGKSATVTANVKFTLPSNFTTDASGGYGGSGDGWGVPNIARAVKGFAQKNAQGMSNYFMNQGGIGGLPVGGSGLNAFNGIASRFGLTIGSGFRPGSITSSGNLSYHAMGRARDFPGTASQMMMFAKFMAATFGSRLKELIYTPLGFSIKNGQRTAPYAQKDHYDHVHVAMRSGGKVKPGRHTSPQVLFAEERNHPEYFISTNPRDKRRSMQLLVQATNEISGNRISGAFTREHSQDFYAMRSGGRVDKHGVGLRKRKAIYDAAMAAGIPPYVLYGVYGAETNFGKLKNNSSAGAQGPFQFMPGTARAMGLKNPENFWEAVKASAKYLGQYKSRGIRGMLAAYNAGPAGNPNNAETRAYIPRVLSLGGDFSLPKSVKKGGAGAGGGTRTGPRNSSIAVEKAVKGARSSIEVALAQSEAALSAAEGTSGNFFDDIRAIFGYDVAPKRRRGVGRERPRGKGKSGGVTAPRARSARAKAEGGRRRRITEFEKRRRNREGKINDQGNQQTTMGGRQKIRHVAGMIDNLKAQDKQAKDRLKAINKALAGKLTPTRRNELLSEKAQLTQQLGTNRTRIQELRKQGAEARFERKMRQSGIGALVDIEGRKAAAAGTTTLDDDLAAVQSEQQYYAARIEWAKKRKDTAAQTEAQNAYNAATTEIRTITDQIRQDRFNVEEAWITYAEGAASLTGTLTDDWAAVNNALAYWNARIAEAWGRGDALGALNAAGQVQQYTERARTLAEDMKRLPLERDAALAELTEDLEDDKRATRALRDYWQERLNAAKAAGDDAAIIEAAGNLKSLNDEIKAGEESISAQMILLSDARRDLYQSFGSNFLTPAQASAMAATSTTPAAYNFPKAPMSSTPANAQPGMRYAQGTTVNLTVNGQTLPDDPHSWSKAVVWEVQAAV